MPEVLTLEVGRNISESPSAQDIFLYTEFENEEAMNNYQDHPEHIKVVEQLKELVDSRYVVDYVV